MQEPAPKGIRLVDKDIADLHTKTVEPVGQIIGHPVTPQSLNPEDESPLGRIAEEVGNIKRYTEASFEDAVQGGNETGRIHTVSKGGRLPVSINTIRQKFLSKKAA